jgi:hypothetical protein
MARIAFIYSGAATIILSLIAIFSLLAFASSSIPNERNNALFVLVASVFCELLCAANFYFVYSLRRVDAE